MRKSVAATVATSRDLDLLVSFVMMMAWQVMARLMTHSTATLQAKRGGVQ